MSATSRSKKSKKAIEKRCPDNNEVTGTSIHVKRGIFYRLSGSLLNAKFLFQFFGQCIFMNHEVHGFVLEVAL